MEEVTSLPNVVEIYSHRKLCSKCRRPENTCLCAILPPTPIQTKTSVLILQHPHEAGKKRGTVSILKSCLSQCAVIQRRKLIESDIKDWLFTSNVVGYQKQVLFLFPSKEASPLVDFLAKDFSKWDVTQLKEKDTMTEKLCSAFLLLVFDGTWQQAKEMVNASIQLLKECTIPVCLPFDEKKSGPPPGHNSLIVRKEPKMGFVSTFEAVSRALGMLEDNGVEIEKSLLTVLQKVVDTQEEFKRRANAPKFV